MADKVLLKTAAAAVKNLKKERDEALEKLAALEEDIKNEKRARDQLIKLASLGEIEYNEIEGQVQELSQLEPKDFEIQLGVMEKLASKSFLNVGEISNKKDIYSEDPLGDLIASYSGV